MPIYEYKCKKCGEVTEVLQGFNDKPLTKCKSCKGKIERIISLSAFHLKGTGWYETDHGKKKAVQSKVPNVESPFSNESSNGDSVDTGGAHTANDATQKLDSIKKDTEKAKSKSKDT